MAPGITQTKAGHKKHIIRGHVKSVDGMIFIVGRDKRSKSERNLLLHFGRSIPYRVVKLSTKDLPRDDGKGHKIKWLGNFGLRNARGRFVKKVRYSLILPALRKNRMYVYYENGELKEYEPVPGVSPVVQIELTSGDPGIGILPK